MKKLFFYIVLSGIITTTGLNAAAVQNKNKRHTLLAFLDNVEMIRQEPGYGHFGPMAMRTMIALVQKPGPIVASTSIIYNLFTLSKNNQFPKSDAIKIHFQNQFQEADWIIKKINGAGHTLLLIPKDFIRETTPGHKNKTNAELDAALEKTIGFLTPVEIATGLLFNRMETTSIDAVKSRYGTCTIEDFRLLHDHITRSFVRSVLSNTFFVSHDLYHIGKEYTAEKLQEPIWTIGLHAHSNVPADWNDEVMQIPIDTFKELLHFFDTKITTQLLFYHGCFTSGYWADRLYGTFKESVGFRLYSFAIASQATTDTVTSTPPPHFSPEGTLISRINYAQLARIMSEQHPDIATALATIFIMDSLDLNEIPQLRPAHVPTFFPLTYARKNIVSISKTMATSRTQPLVIKHDDPLDGRVILLYAHETPFPIVIKTDIAPAFISMSTQATVKNPASIDTIKSYIPLNDFIAQLKKYPITYSSERMIWIKKFHDMIFNYRTDNILIRYTPDSDFPDITVGLDPHDYILKYRPRSLRDTKSNIKEQHPLGSPEERDRREGMQNIERSLTLPFKIKALAPIIEHANNLYIIAEQLNPTSKQLAPMKQLIKKLQKTKKKRPLLDSDITNAHKTVRTLEELLGMSAFSRKQPIKRRSRL